MSNRKKIESQCWLSLSQGDVTQSEEVKFDDFSLELQSLGLQVIYVEGEHHILAVDEGEVISLQNVDGKVTPYQIDNSLKLIERYNLIDGPILSDYHINIFYSEEDEGYIADIPDLAYCSAFGDTPLEALSEIQIAKEIWLEVSREDGKEIPPPRYRPIMYQVGGGVVSASP